MKPADEARLASPVAVADGPTDVMTVVAGPFPTPPADRVVR